MFMDQEKNNVAFIRRILYNAAEHSLKKETIMKKIALLTLLAIAVTACGSYRTKNNGKTYYNTFFGISIESAVWGDGLIIGK